MCASEAVRSLILSLVESTCGPQSHMSLVEKANRLNGTQGNPVLINIKHERGYFYSQPIRHVMLADRSAALWTYYYHH